MDMRTAEVTQEPVVPFFTGVTLAVDECVMGRNALRTKMRSLDAATKDLADALADRQCVPLKLAAEANDRACDEIVKIAGQIKILSQTLARVSAAHAKRESKVRT